VLGESRGRANYDEAGRRKTVLDWDSLRGKGR
jgi:hypothetical protein